MQFILAVFGHFVLFVDNADFLQIILLDIVYGILKLKVAQMVLK